MSNVPGFDASEAGFAAADGAVPFTGAVSLGAFCEAGAGAEAAGAGAEVEVEVCKGAC